MNDNVVEDIPAITNHSNFLFLSFSFALCFLNQSILYQNQQFHFPAYYQNF